MDEITVRNFRCFRAEQKARMAPLTLIVGENSTGKTSFLAMIRALWEVAYKDTVPDFKEEPYDLGTFAEIAHHRGGRGGRPSTFEGGFHVAAREGATGFSFKASFAERAAAPFPGTRVVSDQTTSVTAVQSDGQLWSRFTTQGRTWDHKVPAFDLRPPDDARLFAMRDAPVGFDEDDYDPPPTPEDWNAVHRVLNFSLQGPRTGPFASAPVRSKPRRTYDPGRPARDPEGDHVPMLLAHLYRQRKRDWQALQRKLERFGQAAGLFDDISIKSLGPRDSEPFQVQVRKRGTRLKGPRRNLIDVGYGVSQVLPLITELLRPDSPSLFLLQQPEVHLHPSAQAALGTLFCEVAGKDRQLVVETHSDHLINRIRLDLRDGTVPLAPEDVSLLYFERDELEVRIHSLHLDGQGNVRGAPPGYGAFFMNETARSLDF